jgi:colanic acid/amylovoran biosynthesis protein
MRYCMFHGFSGTNRGDAAIVLGMLGAFARHDPQATWHVVPTIGSRDRHYDLHAGFFRDCGIELLENPFPVTRIESGTLGRVREMLVGLRQARSCLRAVQRHPAGPWPALADTPWQRTVQTIAEADIAVVKGGASLYSYGGIRGNLDCIRFAFPLALAQALGKTVIAFGQTIGPVRGLASRYFMQRSLARFTRLYVRDELSANLAKQLGSPSSLMPDPAFYLYEPDSAPKASPAGSPVRLGVTVRPVSTDRDRQAHYERTIIESIEAFCADRPTEVLFLPQVTTPHPRNDDLPTCRRVCAQLKRPQSRRVVEGELTVAEIMDQYATMDLVLATRLHSAILSLDKGTPVTVIDYHGHKARGVFRMIGLERLVHSMQEMSPESIRQRLEELLAGAGEIRTHLNTVLPRIKEEIAARAGDVVALALEAKRSAKEAGSKTIAKRVRWP